MAQEPQRVRRDAGPEAARERRDLESQLEFVLNDLAATRKRLAVAEMQLHDVATRLQGKLREVYGSTSWRFSVPVRWFGNNFPLVRRAWKKLVPGVAPLDDVDPNRRPATPKARAEAWPEYRRMLRGAVLPRLASSFEDLPRRPRISVLVPTYETQPAMLRALVQSVRAQVYPDWELCIADDGSKSPALHALLDELAALDSRIKVARSEANKGVSHASNQALALATGEFVVLADHDDLLEEQALLRFAETIVEDDPDFAYSDELLVDAEGEKPLRYAYRPVFSLEYLRSHPYIVHLTGYRTQLLRDLGGWDETLAISQDYDLLLRASERARRIVHIPEILYRWRIHEGSAGEGRKSEVMEVSRAALARHLERSGIEAAVEDGPGFNLFSVRYPLRAGLRVAIVIPTKNHGELVRQCIESLRRTITEVEYDILLVDHESDDPATLEYLASISGSVNIVRYVGPFNFSAINNWAVSRLPEGYSHYLLCNNDIEAIEPGWLGRMLELGQQDDVGIVGAHLYYPDRKSIQHAGVCVGLFSAAEHYGKHVQPGDWVEHGYVELLSINHEVGAVTAACLLVRADAWKRAAGFDEAIAVGFGDVDFCLRVAEAGWRVVQCSHARLVHHESYTRKVAESDPHPVDTALFRIKWMALLGAGDPYYSPNLSLTSSKWEIEIPIPCGLQVRRRVYERDADTGRPRLTFSPRVDPRPMLRSIT
jgi:GT2 family glycosyltransferase